jgi:hypothetical protein
MFDRKTNDNLWVNVLSRGTGVCFSSLGWKGNQKALYTGMYTKGTAVESANVMSRAVTVPVVAKSSSPNLSAADCLPYLTVTVAFGMRRRGFVEGSPVDSTFFRKS